MNNNSSDSNNKVIGENTNKYRDYLPENRFPEESMVNNPEKSPLVNNDDDLKIKLCKAYIGDKYPDFEQGGFSFYTFIFGWAYYLYRRMYKIGLIAAGVGILFLFIQLYYNMFLASMLSLALNLFLAFNFKKWYMLEVSKRVDDILLKYKDLSEEELILKVSKCGGVDFKGIIFGIIYLIFVYVLSNFLMINSLNGDYIQLSRETISNFSEGYETTYFKGGHEFNSINFTYNGGTDKCILTYEIIDGYALKDYNSVFDAAEGYYSEILNVNSNLLEKSEINNIEFWNYSVNNETFYAFTTGKNTAKVLKFDIERNKTGKCLEYKDNIFNNVHYMGK